MSLSPCYAEVAVYLPIYGTYHYSVPARMRRPDLLGARVLVRFGNRGGITGVVVSVADTLPEVSDNASASYDVRPLEAVLDTDVRLSAELLGLCLWIAEYYEAPPGEVFRTALPAGTQVSSQTMVELTEAGRMALMSGGALSRKHRDILGALLAAGEATPPANLISSKVKRDDLAELAEEGLLHFVESVRDERMRAKTVRTAILARTPSDEDRAQLVRAPSKLAALTALECAGGVAPVAALKADMPHIATHLRGLATMGLVRFEERDAPPAVARAGGIDGVHAPASAPALNERQAEALAAIRAGLKAQSFAAYLLHGITGSGKTEVYLHAIADVIAAGKTALVLVPEISLTPQLAARFRARFGDQVAILHSGLGGRERYDEWQRLRSGTARIALGARSAIFAPVSDLGMIVVDEEHDSSFKQEDGVRYHGRDVALVRAKRAGAVCVLGSATPSLESYYAAQSGRYQLLLLPERATPRPLPDVELIDLRTFRADDEAMLTAPLRQAIHEVLERGEQVILFLNRRGFDTFVLCRACGYAFRCEQCSVSLTYHRYIDRLMCHYCGYERRIPERCPECETPKAIMRRGLGTEKIADAITRAFAPARVARLDRDVASGSRIDAILSRMARREVDILVGTQMVTKGHDFPGVTLVGVLCADTGLSLPDFRAGERTFQLLTQVAGRAGRGDKPGRVIIQSYRPQTPAITTAAKQDYSSFYSAESAARQELGYPPFGHLVAFRMDGPDGAKVQAVATEVAQRINELREAQGIPIAMMGPAEAPIGRLKGRVRWHVWLRAPDRSMLRRVLRAVMRADMSLGSVRVSIDVDPVSAL